MIVNIKIIYVYTYLKNKLFLSKISVITIQSNRTRTLYLLQHSFFLSISQSISRHEFHSIYFSQIEVKPLCSSYIYIYILYIYIHISASPSLVMLIVIHESLFTLSVSGVY